MDQRRTLTAGRILIVDDQPANLRMLERMLDKEGFRSIASTTRPQEVIELYESFQPDLILLDLVMPGMDGVAVLGELRRRLPRGAFLPVLVLTADNSPEAKRRALAAGAKDFLTKPFDAIEVILRISNLLETRALHLATESHNRMLEQRVEERTQELQEARSEALERLALAAEHRDDDTREHIRRVGALSARIAEAMELPAEVVDLIRQAAPLHDVGKIGIPDRILLKPGKLTGEEFEEMKAHTTIGAGVLSGSSSQLLRVAEEIALAHHERWDGSGYPRGLERDQIPLPARIVAVADVFDALTHERPYKEAWPLDQALAEIEQQARAHFDPRIVEIFLHLDHLGSGLPVRAAG